MKTYGGSALVLLPGILLIKRFQIMHLSTVYIKIIPLHEHYKWNQILESKEKKILSIRNKGKMMHNGCCYLIRRCNNNFRLPFKILQIFGNNIKFPVNDILNQNSNINRSIAGNYISHSGTVILQRYFLLSFTFNFNRFGPQGSYNKNHNQMRRYRRM